MWPEEKAVKPSLLGSAEELLIVGSFDGRERTTLEETRRFLADKTDKGWVECTWALSRLESILNHMIESKLLEVV